MSRHTFASSFLQSVPIQLSRPCRHPSIRTLCERSSLGARWVFSFSRCCYLIIDLSSHLFGLELGPRTWSQSPGLGGRAQLFGLKLSRPQHASLFGYCAMVRIPLRLPTTDGAVLPAFEPRQLPLVSWHFFLLALQASVPISADHCLLQKVPECSALPAPSSFADSGLLLC